VVGPEGSGKTSLLNKFVNGAFEDQDLDSLFMVYDTSIWYADKRYRLSVQDTKSTNEFLLHRIPLYKEADIIIITFSVGCRASYTEACNKWLKETREYNPGVPLILVGCKTDLYHNTHSIERRRLMDESYLSRREILDKMRYIHPSRYCECSALSSVGINQIFELVVQLYIRSQNSSGSLPRTFTFQPLAMEPTPNGSTANMSILLKVMRILM